MWNADIVPMNLFGGWAAQRISNKVHHSGHVLALADAVVAGQRRKDLLFHSCVAVVDDRCEMFCHRPKILEVLHKALTRFVGIFGPLVRT